VISAQREFRCNTVLAMWVIVIEPLARKGKAQLVEGFAYLVTDFAPNIAHVITRINVNSEFVVCQCFDKDLKWFCHPPTGNNKAVKKRTPEDVLCCSRASRINGAMEDTTKTERVVAAEKKTSHGTHSAHRVFHRFSVLEIPFPPVLMTPSEVAPPPRTRKAQRRRLRRRSLRECDCMQAKCHGNAWRWALRVSLAAGGILIRLVPGESCKNRQRIASRARVLHCFIHLTWWAAATLPRLKWIFLAPIKAHAATHTANFTTFHPPTASRNQLVFPKVLSGQSPAKTGCAACSGVSASSALLLVFKT